MKLNQIFEPKGLLSKKFKSYEHRPEQLKMAEMVKQAIDDNRQALIEGGTGVGKSFAYLVPAILSKKKIIVSTSNKSLQDQLNNNDLPLLKKVLPQKFNWHVLKGKTNYFCPEHFSANMPDLFTYLTKEEINKIAKWAEKTKDGDIEYLPLEIPYQVKDMITCGTLVQHEKDSAGYHQCFANQARKKAHEAQIVLVNHTLLALHLVLQLQSEGKVNLLPNPDVVIMDEAHSFEKYAAMALSDTVNRRTLTHLLGWGIVKKSLDSSDVRSIYKAFDDVAKNYVPEKRNEYYTQLKVEKFAGLSPLILMLKQLKNKIKTNSKLPNNEETLIKRKQVETETNNLIDRLRILSKADDNMIRWSEAFDRQDKPVVSLKSAPLSIGDWIKDVLFKDKAVICTSATLSTNNNFSFAREALGVPDNALELIVGSPFDYKKNCLVYTSSGQYDTLHEIEELLKASKGRAFVLFTSYKAMNSFHELTDVPYPKLLQTQGMSRHHLLKAFKRTKNAVLFGTKSFWEGVDIPGEQLSMVIIHKIPFGNPSDILYSSKTEQIDKKYGSGKHWMKYTIPEACLSLKQGTGRLIRSTTDRGVIALLDSRINHKNYGKAVVNSLPPAYRTQKLEKVKAFFTD